MASKRKPPASVRVNATRARRLPSGSALLQLQYEFLDPRKNDDFMAWRNHPYTLLMVDALRELGVTPPVAYIDTEDIGVQFGVSSGLALAAAFVSDPRVLYPHLFSGATPGPPAALPPADYSVDPESAAGLGFAE